MEFSNSGGLRPSAFFVSGRSLSRSKYAEQIYSNSKIMKKILINSKAIYTANNGYTSKVTANYITADKRCLGKHKVSIRFPYAKGNTYVPIANISFID